VGFDVEKLHETGAAFLESQHPGPPPKMIWPTNAGKLGSATMFTLFFGGDSFAPRTRIDGVGAQRYLQEHFFGAVEQVVRRVAALPNVFGVDLLNEPSAGYIGWEDLEVPGGPVEVGLMPSPLQSMALGMGRSLEVKRFHRGLLGPRVVGREVMNVGRARAWRGNCVWLENGVWLDEDRPRLAKPLHFREHGEFAADFLAPFHAEGAERIHRIAPHLVVMLQGEALAPGPPWKGRGPAAWSSHWYDGYVLFMKDFRSFLAADAFTQRPVFGAARIRKSFEQQLRRLADEARARGLPLLVGELGIAFDLRGGRAFRSSDYSLQRAAMNRTMVAVEDAGVSATLWNYTADNTHAKGDGWNGEDLSIFSVDPGDRALDAVVRPRALAIAGTLLRTSFELKSRRFELSLRHTPSITAPTEVYVPRLHYPQGAQLEVSGGQIALEGQRATWTHAPSATEQALIISPTR
jgi:hypothetical protein